MKEFTIKEAHLKLAQKMYIGWQNCEYGAPEINPKRPYGNSDVSKDVLEILGIPYNDKLEDFAYNLHKEMETALQIFLCTKSFVIGTYRKKDEYTDISWELINK